MSLMTELRPVVDRLRALPAELGFRTYQVWVRKTQYAGTKVGEGTKSVTDTRLLVGGRDPKVREVKRKDNVAGMSQSVAATYDIGPLTPEFAGGGIAESLVKPEANSTPTTIMFLIKGPGLPSDGLLCQKIEDHFDRPLRLVIRVRGAGRSG